MQRIDDSDVEKLLKLPLNLTIREKCQNSWNFDMYELNATSQGKSLIQYGFNALKEFQ